eukprot:546263-Rhodomonas_salina.4
MEALIGHCLDSLEVQHSSSCVACTAPVAVSQSCWARAAVLNSSHYDSSLCLRAFSTARIMMSHLRSDVDCQCLSVAALHVRNPNQPSLSLSPSVRLSDSPVLRVAPSGFAGTTGPRDHFPLGSS